MNGTHIANYQGKQIECVLITEENISECIKAGIKGHYGDIKVGSYMYWTGAGFDYFWVVINKDDESFKLIRKI